MPVGIKRIAGTEAKGCGENHLNWQLDVTFNEDRSRKRVDRLAENYSRLNRLALNLLKLDKSIKVSIRCKRFHRWPGQKLSPTPYLHLIRVCVCPDDYPVWKTIQLREWKHSR